MTDDSQTPRASNPPPPIPASYYSAGQGASKAADAPHLPPPPTTGAGGSRTRAASWYRQIPGFRTGKRWKQVVGALGYIVIIAWILQIGTNPPLGILGLLSLASVGLATNAFGVRLKLPAFNSPNRLWAGTAWAVLAGAMFVTAALADPSPGNSNLGVGTGPSESSSPVAIAPARSSPTSSSAKASVTPSPKPSTKPSQKPSPRPAPKASPRPTPTSTHKPSPPPPMFNYCGAPSNPWHYNFCAANSGTYITSPAAGICSYFNCIGNFWNGVGYVVECSDGTYSKSGGRSGVCSYHSGVLRPLWA